MTALNRNNIPADITTLEGLMAWCMATYTAAYGGKQYGERSAADLQRFSRYSIAPVTASENDSSIFMIGRIAVPVSQEIAAASGPVWLNTVEHSGTISLPAGYTV